LKQRKVEPALPEKARPKGNLGRGKRNGEGLS